MYLNVIWGLVVAVYGCLCLHAIDFSNNVTDRYLTAPLLIHSLSIENRRKAFFYSYLSGFGLFGLRKMKALYRPGVKVSKDDFKVGNSSDFC